MTSKREDRSRQAVFVLSAGALAGVLIWSKLRLVTDIPRSAYAEPETYEPVVPPATPDEGGGIMPDSAQDPDVQDEDGSVTDSDAERRVEPAPDPSNPHRP